MNFHNLTVGKDVGNVRRRITKMPSRARSSGNFSMSCFARHQLWLLCRLSKPATAPAVESPAARLKLWTPRAVSTFNR